MSKNAVVVHRAAMERYRRRQNGAVTLIVKAHTRWWRVDRNWRLRRDARALLAHAGDDLAEASMAWDAMSPSERAAETARALRGSAFYSSRPSA